MQILRPLIALLLSLGLVWASAAQAVARGGSLGQSTVTLCGDAGQGQTVTLDAGGNPSRPVDCGHCLAAHAGPAALAAAPALTAPLALPQTLDLRPGQSLTGLSRTPRDAPPARAPPFHAL